MHTGPRQSMVSVFFFFFNYLFRFVLFVCLFVVVFFLLFKTLILLRTVPWICREVNLSDHNSPLEAKTNRNGIHHAEIPENKEKRKHTES